MSKKMCPIAVRFTYDERASIKKAAYKDGVSLSAYIRERVLPETPLCKISSFSCGKCEEVRTILRLLLVKGVNANTEYQSILINGGLDGLLQDLDPEVVRYVEKLLPAVN